MLTRLDDTGKRGCDRTLAKERCRRSRRYNTCSRGVNFILADLEKEKKDLLASAAEKEKALKAKIKTIGNIVHKSVPISNNEVGGERPMFGYGSRH